MSKWEILCILLVATAICLFIFSICDFSNDNSKSVEEEKIAPNRLPVANNDGWIKIDVKDNYAHSTYVLELKTGWLVRSESGFGTGVTFVPKEKSE